MATGIQWTDETWNPVTGCAKVSPGCAHCYAEDVAVRFWPTQYPPVEYVTCSEAAGCSHPDDADCNPVTESRPRAFTDVMCHEDRLDQPLRWKKPRRIFVNSMSDLFHEDVPDTFIDRVFAVMALAPQHTFQVLTKRPERMRAYLSDGGGPNVVRWVGPDKTYDRVKCAAEGMMRADDLRVVKWPLANVWLGVSVENQHFADERIPLLLQTPAAVRFLSCEPLLSHLNIIQFLSDKYISQGGRQWIGAGGIGWVIVGGESGKDARPFDIAWARSIIAQCATAGVACFVKQLGHLLRDGDRLMAPSYGGDQKRGDPDEWPSDLRVREFPR